MSDSVTPFVYNALLDRVVDGDTIDVVLDLGFSVKLHKQRVRLAGKGKYGRILGIPYTEDGKSICQMLIDEGHAVEYWGGKKTAKVRDDGTWGE
jgi:endonuclease YncB( thermonuclease family)